MNGGYAVNKSILPFLAILVLILFSAPVRANCIPGNGWVSFVYNSFPPGPHSVSASDPVGAVIVSSGLVNSSWGAANVVSLSCPPGSLRTWNMTGLTTFTTIGGKQVYDTGLAGVGVYIYATRGDGTVMGPFPVIQTFNGPVTSGTTGPRLEIQLIKTATVVNGGTLNLATIYREYATSSTTSAQFNMTTVNLNNVTIVTGGCSVATQSLSIPVSLGLTPQTDFTGVGTTSQSIPFNIDLIDCSANSNVKVTFSDTSGSPSPGIPGVLALTSGGATGVGIQLLNATDTPIPLDIPFDVGQTVGTTFSIPLKARYYQTGTTMTTGPANSTANFTMTYD
ncbi:MAG: fimbrial protein [Yersinia sp. (in: enterobacteria)]